MNKISSKLLLFIVVSMLVVAGFGLVEWNYRYRYYLENIADQFKGLTAEIKNKSTKFEESIRILDSAAETLKYHHVNSAEMSFLKRSKAHPDGYSLDTIRNRYPEYGNLTLMGKTLTEEKKKEISMALALQPLLAGAKEGHSEVPWVYYTSDNFIFIYPFLSDKEFFFNEKELLIDRDFYKLGKPEHNPKRLPFWTAPYVDSAGEGLMVTLASPVYDGKRFLGTVAMDYKFSVFAMLLPSLKIASGDFLLLSKKFEQLSAMDYASGKYQIEKNALVAANLTDFEKNMIRNNSDYSVLEQDGLVYNIGQIDPLGVTLFFKIKKSFVILDSLKKLQFTPIFLILVFTILVVVILYSRMEAEKVAVAEEHNRLVALGEMCGGIAHEINSPLTVIKGNITICKRVIEKGDQAQYSKLVERLDISNNTVDRIADIVAGLRFFSKDYDTSRHEVFLLSEVLEMTYPLLSGKLKNHEIQFSSDIRTNNLFIKGVRVEISQVLLNLVNNAIDAIVEQSAKERWIRFVVERNDQDEIMLQVMDSGSGIPDQMMSVVFQPFFSTKSKIRKDRFGLGLSICKGIIEAHGGTISYNKANKVSTFVVKIPSAKKPAMDANVSKVVNL